MPKNYSRLPLNPEKAVKCQGKDVRASFKNTYNTARVLRGMTIKAAQKYLNQVLDHKRCIPYRRFNRSTGRCAQAKEWGLVQGRWPEKSVKIVLNLLANLEANANTNSLDVTKLRIRHVQVNRAQKGRRRTFRAHGRITPFLSHPFHIEMWATEDNENVARERTGERLTRKVVAQRRHLNRVAEGQ